MGINGEVIDDRLFGALGDPRRRHVLEYLGESAAATLSDLAVAVADRERDDRGDRAAPEDVRRIEIELYHVEVPKLEEAGLVDHDRDENVVSITDRGAAVVANVGELLDDE